MLLSIIVTHYRAPKLLRDCLESLFTFIKGIDYEVIVSDSQALPSAKALLQTWLPSKQITYLGFEENVGYARLVNEGLVKAKGTFILIMNADILLKDERSLLLLIDYLKTHSDVGLLGGKLLNRDGSLYQSFFREPTLKALLARRTFFAKTRWGRKALDYFEFRGYNLEHPLEVDWLMGSAFLTTKEAVAKVGKLDERFWMYFEDVDWARRFRMAGYKVVYYPKAVFTNYQGSTSKRKGGVWDLLFNPYTRIHFLSWLKYISKWRIRGFL